MRLTTLVVAVHYNMGDKKMLSLDSMSCCPTLQGPLRLPMAPLDSGSLSSLLTGPISGLPRDLHRP
jgi:hypothetical protein